MKLYWRYLHKLIFSKTLFSIKTANGPASNAQWKVNFMNILMSDYFLIYHKMDWDAVFFGSTRIKEVSCFSSIRIFYGHFFRYLSFMSISHFPFISRCYFIYNKRSECHSIIINYCYVRAHRMEWKKKTSFFKRKTETEVGGKCSFILNHFCQNNVILNDSFSSMGDILL